MINLIARNRAAVREQVLQLGKFAKEATKIEMRLHKGAWTSDHWSANDVTYYTTSTKHYIKNWIKRNLLIDFCVFYGSTSGAKIFELQQKVLELESDILGF
jgi:hypothetical protein